MPRAPGTRFVTTEKETRGADGPEAYVSRSRNVHLVCAQPYSSEFVAALEEYLQAIGLTPSRREVTDSSALHSLVDAVRRHDHVALLPVSGQKPPSEVGASLSNGLSSLSIAAIEVCVAELGPDRCMAIAQMGDPVSGDELSVEVTRISDSRASRDVLKRHLANAGCAISAEILASDQRGHSFEFPQEWWNVNGEPQATPSFMEFLVDAAFNRELTQTKLQEEAMERVRNATELDLKYHYVGWKMAENWNALTDDRTYGHAAHRRALSSQIGEMAAVLPKDVSFRYVSLGPGDGKTDAALLPALAKELSISSCFFVDVSIELLQVATNRVITDLIETGELSPRHIRAVLGDFEDSLLKLAPVLSGFGERSFFSLSGFTVGNSQERHLLKSLADGMQEGDFLLLDARLHGLGPVKTISDDQKEELLRPYETHAMRKFAFGPVEDLCDYTVRLDEADVEIKFNPKVGTTLATNVDNAINVYIDAYGLYGKAAFRKKIGMKSRFGSGMREKNKSLRLVTLTFYDFDSLAEWIDRTGEFRVRWKNNLERIGVFLLERLGEPG